jgi:CheY-like chemotaxis protein/anti-sigma regulatory factor (Ser/Thr protein kinase)
MASQRAKDLVRQILAFSRRSEQKREPTQLTVVVADAIKLLRSVLPSSIEIRPRLPEGLPQILADVTQINQIVVNLATNGAHAMEEHGGCLEIIVDEVQVDAEMARQRQQLKPGHFLRLWITDTGAGMSAEIIERIFEPFFTTKEPGKGTGLGLAVVHGIVQQHEGVIVVYSVVGKGTSFQIYFPVIKAVANARIPATPSSTPISRRGAGRCIMVVDDESLVLSVTENILRRAGYRVMPFNDPVMALKAFSETPAAFDLIITDLTMPRIKGTKLAADIRQIRPGIPVILSTGFGGDLDYKAIQASGLSGPLQKPFTSEALLEAVMAALGTV